MNTCKKEKQLLDLELQKVNQAKAQLEEDNCKLKISTEEVSRELS
jgi:hypothetical protein